MKGWILEALLNPTAFAARFTEAARVVLSLDEVMARVQGALCARFTPGKDYGCYALQTFDDHVIYRNNQKTWSIDYELTKGGDVELAGEPVEVVQRYAPIAREAFLDANDPADRSLIRIEAEILGPILEAGAAAPSGREWDVLLIREGMSKNRNRYGKKCLAEAAPLYEGRPMFIDHKLEAGPFGRSGTEVVGFTKNVRAVILSDAPAQEGQEAKFPPQNFLALAGRAGIIDESFQKKLLAAHQLGNPDLFGLSHDVRAESVTATQEDGPFYDVTSIRKVESTDWVLNPAAGGRVLRLVASDTTHPQLQEDARMLKSLLEALKKAGVAVPENCDEPTATRLLTEALARTPAPVAAAVVVPAVVVPPVATPVTESAEYQALATRLALTEAANKLTARNLAASMLERSLLECALPDPFKARIRKRFTAQLEAGTIFADTDVVAAIAEAVEDVGALREANLVMPHVGMPRAQITKDRSEKLAERMADFYDPSKPMQSFREMYIDITGDTKVTGKVTEDVRRRISEFRLAESLNTTSFDQILGDSITRRMLKDYADSGLATWRNTIAEVTPLNDFRTVRRMRFGGYGNLATVTQGSPYLGVTSPTDEEATYSPAKRGGTEMITIEMIKNDDVAAIRRIPGKLARAAAQTLHEFVWDMLQTNANVYDAVALAAAGHNNIVTTALSGANVSSLRLKIKQQADMSNGKRIGLAARYLIVPSELEELAFQLTTSDRVLGSNNNDPNFVKKLNLDTIVVEYWTDTNNYWVVASVDQAPMIEVGFLDGQETPELFVQDLPSQGSMFSNDQLTYKVRHIYGGAVMDFRPFAGGIVP